METNKSYKKAKAKTYLEIFDEADFHFEFV